MFILKILVYLIVIRGDFSILNNSNPQVTYEIREAQVDESLFCSCVKTARKMGVDLPRGDAKDLKPNSTPVVGGAVLFNYSGVYHVAYIDSMTEEGMYIKEGNFEKCKYTERFVLFTDPFLRGFWHPL